MLLERLPAHGIDLALGMPADHRVEDPPPGWQVDVLRHRRGLHWITAPLIFTPYAIRLLRARRRPLRGHSSATRPSAAAGKGFTGARFPVALHHHHLYPRWARLEGAIARRADAVITVSEHSRGELIEAGVSPARIHVVLEGVATHPPTDGWTKAWPSAGMRRAAAPRPPRRAQSPAVAVDAPAALATRRHPAFLVLAGDGPSRQSLAERATAPVSCCRAVHRAGIGARQVEAQHLQRRRAAVRVDAGRASGWARGGGAVPRPSRSSRRP